MVWQETCLLFLCPLSINCFFLYHYHISNVINQAEHSSHDEFDENEKEENIFSKMMKQTTTSFFFVPLRQKMVLFFDLIEEMRKKSVVPDPNLFHNGWVGSTIPLLCVPFILTFLLPPVFFIVPFVSVISSLIEKNGLYKPPLIK